MKKIYLHTLCILIVLLSACSKNTSVSEIIAEETSTSSDSEINTRELTGNPLFDAVPLLEDDINSFGREVKTDQSETIKISKKEFDSITNQQFTEFFQSYDEDSPSDWIAVLVDDGTAIILFRGDEVAAYGEWNSEKGIIKELGFYKPDDEGTYYFENRTLP